MQPKTRSEPDPPCGKALLFSIGTAGQKRRWGGPRIVRWSDDDLANYRKRWDAKQGG